MFRAWSPYRQAQARSDLRGLARHLAHRRLAPDWPVEGDQAYVDQVLAWQEAARTDGRQDRRAFALAALLADALDGGLAEADTAALFAQHADAALAWPAPTRAALLNAWREVLARSDTLPRDFPHAACIALEREAVLAPLRALAKTIPPEGRDQIARWDYEREVARYRASLERILESETCELDVLGPDGFDPGEVVQLESHDITGRWGPACTALLMIWVITSPDDSADPARDTNALEYRWARSGADYLALPEPARSALLRGLRHVYERTTGFDPYWEFQREPAGGYALLPWLSPDT